MEMKQIEQVVDDSPSRAHLCMYIPDYLSSCFILPLQMPRAPSLVKTNTLEYIDFFSQLPSCLTFLEPFLASLFLWKPSSALASGLGSFLNVSLKSPFVKDLVTSLCTWKAEAGRSLSSRPASSLVYKGSSGTVQRNPVSEENKTKSTACVQVCQVVIALLKKRKEAGGSER